MRPPSAEELYAFMLDTMQELSILEERLTRLESRPLEEQFAMPTAEEPSDAS
jgi:hypothetical protein